MNELIAHLALAQTDAASPLVAPYLAVAVLSCVVGLGVALRERNRGASLPFLATTLAVGTYMLGFAFMTSAEDPATAMGWARVAYLGVPFIVPAIVHFGMVLLGIMHRRRHLVAAGWAVGVVHSALAVTSDILLGGVVLLRWGYYTALTPWSALFMGWTAVLLAVLIGDFLREQRHADPAQRARIRWFAIPLAVASLGIVDYLPALGAPVPPLGFLVFPVFLLASAWAVQRYHLPKLTPELAAGQIIAAMNDPLMVCRPDGRMAVINDATYRLTGFGPAQLADQPLAMLLGDPADAVLTRETRRLEAALSTRSGEPIDVSLSSVALRDRTGRVMGMVVTARDIRERRRAAEELRRREQHFRALIEHGLDTITVLSASGRVLYQSPSVRQVLGWDPDKELGTDAFRRIHPDDVGRVRAEFAALGRRPGSTVETVARLAHGDGGYRHFELRGRNLLGHPAVEGIVVNGRDVTTARQLEEQLHQSQRMEAIGHLAGGVAHDFNNLLTAMQGNLGLIREQVPPDSPLADELGEVERAAQRAARLTDQLLAFSRRKMVQADELDLVQVVDEMAGLFRRLLGPRRALALTLPGEPCLIRADRAQVEQILMNLVVNARDAIPDAGEVEIAVALESLDHESVDRLDHHVEPGEYVLLSVADDGVGMNDAVKRRIFEPFFTTKEPGHGTGLGLSTVYGAVRQADGFTGVRSEPGAGTTVLLYFPRVPAGPSLPTGTGATRESPDRERDTVLIVDDDAAVRALMAKVLTRTGYRVLEAADGEAALELVRSREERLDLLIADLVMPGMTGREVAEALGREQPGLPTVLVSGYTADDVVRDDIRGGRHIFLPKPFTPDRLATLVRDVLDGRVVARE